MAKKNGKMLRIIGILVGVAFVLGGAIYAYGRLNEKVDDCEKDIATTCIKDTAQDKMLQKHGEAVVEIRSDVRHILSDMAEQKELSREILKEIRK